MTMTVNSHSLDKISFLSTFFVVSFFKGNNWLRISPFTMKIKHMLSGLAELQNSKVPNNLQDKLYHTLLSVILRF